MSNGGEVLVLNPAYWTDKAPALAQILHTTPADQIGDPTGKPPDPEMMFTIVDPGYWAGQPRELQDALTVASGGSSPQGGRPGIAVGAVSTTQERLTLTVEEAAMALGISRALAYESVRRGEIPHIKIGRRVLVPRAALDRMLSLPGSDNTNE